MGAACGATTVGAPADVLDGCKLTYFPIFMGRGGSVRLALMIAGVQFQEVQILFKDWSAAKPKTPFGNLPILELQDGTRISQTRCILRVIGQFTGMYPKDLVRAAQVDQVMDAMESITMELARVGVSLPQEEKEAARKEAIETGLASEHFHLLDSWIGLNGDGKHCVGDSLTVADIFVAGVATTHVDGLFDGYPPNALDCLPNIQGVRKTVATHPAVVEWVDTHTHETRKVWQDMRNL